MLHPNHHPPALNRQLRLSPAFYFARLLKAVKSGTTQRVSEKREHMSIHYIFIHTLRHVLTPETHTVCSDFLTPACFANLFSTPSIPLFHFIRILFKGNAAYCKLEMLTSGQQTIYWDTAVGQGVMGHSSFTGSASFPSSWKIRFLAVILLLPLGADKMLPISVVWELKDDRYFVWIKYNDFFLFVLFSEINIVQLNMSRHGGSYGGSSFVKGRREKHKSRNQSKPAVKPIEILCVVSSSS